MLMNYHIGRLVLSSLCVGAFGAAGFRWCSFCRLKPTVFMGENKMGEINWACHFPVIIWIVTDKIEQ